MNKVFAFCVNDERVNDLSCWVERWRLYEVFEYYCGEDVTEDRVYLLKPDGTVMREQDVAIGFDIRRFNYFVINMN